MVTARMSKMSWTLTLLVTFAMTVANTCVIFVSWNETGFTSLTKLPTMGLTGAMWVGLMLALAGI